MSSHSLRIGLFGRRNSGKSTMLNCIVGQRMAIVSPQPGTTTDPVRKSMELDGVGPVVWIDTAGVDDVGSLGSQRNDASLNVLAQVDLAVILFCDNAFGQPEQHLVEQCLRQQTPFVLVHSLDDVVAFDEKVSEAIEREYGQAPLRFSANREGDRAAFLGAVSRMLGRLDNAPASLLGDRVGEGDIVLLVTPIDIAAPHGRLILPQVQVLRDLLDHHACAVVCRETELRQTLDGLRHAPRLVITDSQAFSHVAATLPPHMPLTSFSIVLAHAKGPFEAYLKGCHAIDGLHDGDRVLILESCTHVATCEDIGRVKLPRLLLKHTGKQLLFDHLTGFDSLPRPASDYALAIQCGGCVVSRRQQIARIVPLLQADIPTTNYGMALAHLNGILSRAVKPFLSAERSQ